MGDPLILPVKSYEFSKKILLVEVRGSAKVYDGYLKGLSTLHRTGLADMNTNATHVTVRATIGVNDLAGSYKASAKFMNFGPSFGINLNIVVVGSRGVRSGLGSADLLNDVIKLGKLLSFFISLSKANTHLLGSVHAKSVHHISKEEEVKLTLAIPVIDVTDLLHGIGIN